MKQKPAPQPAVEEQERETDLPEGWSEVPLPDVVYFQEGPGLRKWQFGDVGIPFLNIRTFENGRIDKSKCQFVKQEEFERKYEHFLLNEGDIVVSSSGTLGKIATIRASDLPLMLNTSTIRFRALNSESLTQEFLRLYLQSDHFFRQIDFAKTGSAILNYGPSHLKQMLMVLPPPPEQVRIANTADAMVARVTATRKRLAKVPKILKAFRQSVLSAACSGRLTEDWRAKEGGGSRLVRSEWIDPTADLDQLKEVTLPESWALSTIGRMGTTIQAGKNIRCDEHPPRRGEKGIVKISSVTWGEFNEEESKTLLDPSLFRADRKINPGDLLISRANTLELVGACVIVGPITRQLMLSDKVLRLRVDDDWKTWLLFCLRSSLGRFQIERLATGNQLSMRNISQESLESIVIPLPPTVEQHEIVRRVETLFKLVDKIEERVEAATKHADKLTQAILAKAFRGELVPTEAELARKEDRDYEPASALLKRIKSQREKSSASTNGIKRHKVPATKK